jgi:hypothetical protein
MSGKSECRARNRQAWREGRATIAEKFDLLATRVEAALRHYAAYPGEIDAEMTDRAADSRVRPRRYGTPGSACSRESAPTGSTRPRRDVLVGHRQADPGTVVLFSSSRAFPRTKPGAGKLIESIDAWITAATKAEQPVEAWLVPRETYALTQMVT